MTKPPPAPTVCVVDDDPDVLISLRFLLETEGFSVRTFANGPDLLAASPPSPGDCLIIDYKMAGMDGLDLIHRLRAREVRVPVVLMTGAENEGVAVKAARSGIRHFVLKPHIEESLIAHVLVALREGAGSPPEISLGRFP
jgi:two-component system response regulator FixJ